MRAPTDWLIAGAWVATEARWAILGRAAFSASTVTLGASWKCRGMMVAPLKVG